MALSASAGGNVLTLLGMLLAVAGVLALAYVVTRWVGRHGAPRPNAGGGSERFQVLRQLSLGQNERLALVRVGERCLLLGVSPGGVTLLRELTEEEAASWLPRDGAPEPAPPSFWEAVKKNLPQRK